MQRTPRRLRPVRIATARSWWRCGCSPPRASEHDAARRRPRCQLATHSIDRTRRCVAADCVAGLAAAKDVDRAADTVLRVPSGSAVAFSAAAPLADTSRGQQTGPRWHVRPGGAARAHVLDAFWKIAHWVEAAVVVVVVVVVVVLLVSMVIMISTA